MTRDEVIETILNPGTGPPPGSPEHRELMAYLESSPEFQALYEQQQALWETLDEWQAGEPSADFDRRLFERIEGLGARRTWLSGWWGGAFGNLRPSFALGLVALILAAATVLQQPSSTDTSAETAGVMNPEDAEYLEQIDRELDDIEMLVEFEALPLGAGEEGRS